jgi:2-amino-4-hydroxy-6-hydroxymethyldihydropteridine diphosphokinase
MSKADIKSVIPAQAGIHPVVAYIALGANLGDAVQTVRDAIQAINDLPQTQVTKKSSLYKTAAMESLPGAPKSPDYINAVIEIICHQPAYLLLEQLQKIEQKAGRIRPYLNAPRTLDLDVLLYRDESGNAQIQTETLTIPHPRMWQRAFVLVPLAEIAPGLVSAERLEGVRGQGIERLGIDKTASENPELPLSMVQDIAVSIEELKAGKVQPYKFD